MASKHSTDNRAVALTRFSPRPMPEEAKSLEVQEERVQSYAAREGLEIVATFRDPETSARRVPLAKREGGAAMLAYIDRHKIKNVVIAKLDRAFRDTIDGLAWLKKWKKSGVTLHLADQGGCSLNCNTATGELVMTFLLGIASFEPRQTAERTSQSMRHRQRNGQRMSGRLPFGYRLDGTVLREDAGEQEVGRRIIQLSDSHSMRDICRILEADGIKFRGGRWHHTLIRKVISQSSSSSFSRS